MPQMNSEVDQYLAMGCGRCSYYGTPHCKVHAWTDELRQLRRIVLGCGLKEEYKWSQPCYTFRNKNILLITAFKEFAALAFFKGSLLKDPGHILVAPGANSQATRQVRFSGVEEILALEPVLKNYIHEAIEVEKAGLKVNFNPKALAIPAELQNKFDERPDLKMAFDALSPGRQRGYILHFSQPKQSKTRVSRIEKCISRILEGKGYNEQ